MIYQGRIYFYINLDRILFITYTSKFDAHSLIFLIRTKTKKDIPSWHIHVYVNIFADRMRHMKWL